MSEIQRARILDAVVEIVAERGMAGASVGPVIVRAQVSRRTFYQCFAGLEDALIAALYDGTDRVMVLVSRALEGERSWQAAALWVLRSTGVRGDVIQPVGGRCWFRRLRFGVN